MKLIGVNFALAILISGLIAFGFYGIAGEELRLGIALGSFSFAACTLAMIVGVRYEYARTGVNLRVVAAVFLAASLGINAIYAVNPLTQASYLIAIGIPFAIYILLFRAVSRSRQ